MFRLPRTDLSSRFCDGYATRGIAVWDSDAGLDFSAVPLEVPCHDEALPRHLDTSNLMQCIR